MNRHRMGARGNATSFPLPWQDLLEQLKGGEADLPHTGRALSSFVSVLLKTSDEGDTKESLSKFIHQALVRRDVVVRLIEDAKNRGHRAYQHLDMEQVREKARELPSNGVPEHIARLIPYDDLLDKIQVQKAATPVLGRCDLEGAAVRLAQIKPNGVVLEKSSYDETDINAQRIASLQQFASRLNAPLVDDEQNSGESEGSPDWESVAAKTFSQEGSQNKRVKLSGDDATEVLRQHARQKTVERVAVSTGNALIDQFEP